MAVLSIQSHVVAGHVGNSAAVFCLERTGIEAWGLNTLQFSNHAGYEGFTGQVFSPDHISELVAGLSRCVGLKECEAVLSGYIGRIGTGRAVLDAVRRVREANPDALYCCDPVMGDAGRVYVAPEIPDFMRQEALPAADIITPNHFELELLAGRSIHTEAEAVAAARALMAGGRPRLVLVTSFGADDKNGNEISVLSISPDEACKVVTPRLSFGFPPSGAGDMTASLFLAFLLKTGRLSEALSRSVSGVFGVLRKTAGTKCREIGLIPFQDELVSPSVRFDCIKIG